MWLTSGLDVVSKWIGCGEQVTKTWMVWLDVVYKWIKKAWIGFCLLISVHIVHLVNIALKVGFNEMRAYCWLDKISSVSKGLSFTNFSFLVS
jgi:hypothetical protein